MSIDEISRSKRRKKVNAAKASLVGKVARIRFLNEKEDKFYFVYAWQDGWLIAAQSTKKNFFGDTDVFGDTCLLNEGQVARVGDV